MNISITAQHIRDRMLYCNELHISNYNSTSELYRVILNEISRNKQNATTVEQFIQQCKYSKKNIDSNISKYIKLLESSYSSKDNQLSNLFIRNFNDIIHNTTNFNKVILEINNSTINDSTKQYLIQLVENEIICDRIIQNHNKLKKTIDIDSFFEEYKYFENKYDVIFELAYIIDHKFSIPDHAKYAIIMEEAILLFDNPNLTLEAVTDYMLMKYKEINSDYLSQLLSTIYNNKCIDYTRSYLHESETYPDSNDIIDLIHKFNKEERKTEGLLRTIINKIYTKSPSSIIDNTPHILSWLRNLLIIGTFSQSIIFGCVTLFVDKFISISIKRKQMDKMISFFEKEQKNIKIKINKCKDERKQTLEKYLKSFDQAYDKLISYRDSLYTDEELERRQQILYSDIHEMVSADNLIRFKFYHIMSNAKKSNSIIESYYISNNKLNPLNIKIEYNTPSIVLENLPLYIDDAYNLSFSISKFNINNYKNINEVYNLLESICTRLNYEKKDNSIIYTYDVYANEAYINLNFLNKVIITEEDIQKNSDKFKFSSLFTDEDNEKMSNIKIFHDAIDKFIINKGHELNNDIKDVLTEDIIDENVISILMDFGYINGYNFNEMCNIINCIMTESNIYYLDKYKFNTINNADFTLVAESAELIRTILTEVSTTKKSPINLNTIKLAMANLREKVKNMGQKEKEISRTLDIHFNNITRGMESALVSDRREAIIKGSIIPSFSKCIKTAITIGGAYLINPVVAIIGSIGALAASKHLTKKERLLLIDEIDIELKVVERELNNLGDGTNNKEKYRSLLTYQKTLQRERQRIKYSLSLAGKPIMSTKSEEN